MSRNDIRTDDQEHARALEDQWMEGAQGDSSPDPGAFALSRSRRLAADDAHRLRWHLYGGRLARAKSSEADSSQTLLQGAIVGFALPLIPFFFFRTSIFSKRFQMAIMLGVAVNFAFGILQFFA